MRLENTETTERTSVKPNSKIKSIEKMSPKRLLSICRGIAQQSMAMHNSDIVFRIAHRDNKMINENKVKINSLYDEMEENFESGNDYNTVVSKNAEINRTIRRLKLDSVLIKTTKTTSDDIRNRDRSASSSSNN